jgi:hypothetical protein
MVLAALCIALAAPRAVVLVGAAQRGLLALGRASLAVYCIHLEFAFGLAAEPVRKSLGYPAFLIGTAVLIAAMTLFAHVWLGRKDRPPPKHGRNALDLENSAGF